MADNGYARYNGLAGAAGGGTGSGTVTSVSVVNSNGLTGTVANPTTTPAITLAPTLTGIYYSNGTAFSAAVAANFPTLNQNTTGTASNITATTNATLTTISALSLPGSQVSGTVAVTNGGTSLNSLTLNGVLIGNNTSAPTFVAPGSSGNVLTSNGTTWTSAAASSGFTNPMTTLGDIIFENATPAPARLAGNTTAVRQFLNQTGTGTVSASPAWGVLVSGDIPANSANTSGTASNITGTTNATLTSLSTLTTATSLSSVGTITTGTWSGTTISVAKGGTGNTTNVTAPAATTIPSWDANKNFSANSFLEGYTTTVTSGTAIVLTVASAQTQFLTGSTAQTVTLPVTSTLVLGQSFQITNNSTAIATVNSSGANLIETINPGSIATFTCILITGTTAASWSSAGSIVAPTVQEFLSGSGTYTLPTTPRRPLYIVVEMSGGGGGGGGSAASGATAGGNGGTTTFGTSFLTAGGGTGGGLGGPSGGAGGGAGGTATALTGGLALVGGSGSGEAGLASASGGNGGVNPLGGGGGGGAGTGTQTGLAGSTNSGGGGGGAGSTTGNTSASGGGAGGYVRQLVTGSNLAATFAYAVGAAGIAGTGSSANGGAGGSGIVQVTEYYQ